MVISEESPTKPRAIEILDDEFNLARREMVNIPIVGTVTAGEPILAVENITGYFPVPSELMPNAELFMLAVRGESMINAGILDGDHVIVQQQSSADNGDMVVASGGEFCNCQDSIRKKTTTVISASERCFLSYYREAL